MTQISKQINFWKVTSERSWKTAKGLFKLGHYDACLFFCHLTLEKILKGLLVKKFRKAALYTHDLERLALTLGIKLNPEDKQNLRTITDFNISSRYDNVKLDFYRKCDKRYAEKYLKITQNFYLCLKKKYQN